MSRQAALCGRAEFYCTLSHKWRRVLDVGTFTGHFLVAAGEDGWQHREGTEISKQAADYARQTFGITIHEGDLLTLNLPDGAYDAVTLSDVIEHVSDPVATVECIHRILRPGGILYMHTPHFDSIPRYIYGEHWNVFFPWHRMIFSVPAIRDMLHQAGFKITVLRTVGFLPLGTRSAWQRYLKQREQTTDNSQSIPTNSSKERQRLIRNIMRPLWLGAKQAMDIPFVWLSALNIHIGSRLIVCAEKKYQ